MISFVLLATPLTFAQVGDPSSHEHNKLPNNPDLDRRIAEVIAPEMDKLPFAKLLWKQLEERDYAGIVGVGEYLHGFHEFPKRRNFVNDYCSTLNREIRIIPENAAPAFVEETPRHVIPDENLVAILHACGDAVFIDDYYYLTPSAGLKPFLSLTLKAYSFGSPALRQEAYDWLVRIARADKDSAARIHGFCQGRISGLLSLGQSDPVSDLMLEVNLLAGLARVAHGEWNHIARVALQDSEVPQLDGLTDAEIQDLANAAKSKVDKFRNGTTPDDFRNGMKAEAEWKYLLYKLDGQYH